LPPELDALTERLAEHVHDLWALGRMAENWTWGEHRCDEARTHPCLVPYALLSDGEKEYDRTTARKTLLAVIALGYRVMPPEGSAPADGDRPGDSIEAKRGAK
jgi:hypothetical protein